MAQTLSLTQFITHLTVQQAILQGGNQPAVEQACKIVQAEAKRAIGHDEFPAGGPFPRWPELADSTKDEKERLGYVGVRSEYDSLLRTGALHDSIEIVAGNHEGVIGSNDDVAVWQELGTTRIPPRSFLGSAAFRKGKDVALLIGQSVFKRLVGRALGGSTPIP